MSSPAAEGQPPAGQPAAHARHPTVGVLGGGQLGRMMADPAHRLGVRLLFLDVGADTPAKQTSHLGALHVDGSFADPAKVAELAARCDVLTVEIEHVDVAALERARDAHPGLRVHPSPACVAIIQDKFRQKQHLAAADVPVTETRELLLNSHEEVSDVAIREAFGFPMMLKTKLNAYDGRGNAVVRSEKDIDAALKALSPAAPQPLYVEKWVPFTKELAVMVVRTPDNHLLSYPCVETVHRDSICHTVFAPAQVDGLVQRRARKVAERAVQCLPEGAGVYGVEMFLLENGDILVNEIAPRPHNSGHYTIEACHTSQFENHLRAILGLPLGSTALRVQASGMINLLGRANGEEGMADLFRSVGAALPMPGASVHLYGKRECRRGRKMGHITVCADSMAEVFAELEALDAVGQGGAHPGSVTPAGQAYSLSPLVGIIMGSDSDLPTLKPACSILTDFGVPFEVTIVSAHRTPARMMDYARSAHLRGLKVIIAAAGGAAHLPGMVASMTPLPVIGVPVALKVLDGVDSLHSIVQMPRGVPVATVAINNSTNAALLAIRMLGAFIPRYLRKLQDYTKRMEADVMSKVELLQEKGWEDYEVGSG
ncbi:hypothetical protein DFJ74DRAFT_617544 [Hyaloraphidium curvatum]|nr:hypothetical protein DFJ74DRAFT_617544 [Hyaloraphidium curvatum]